MPQPFSDLRNSLTPEQRAKADEMLAVLRGDLLQANDGPSTGKVRSLERVLATAEARAAAQ